MLQPPELKPAPPLAPSAPSAPSEQVAHERLAALERLWDEKFTRQPKLPTAALLTGAVAMAMGFGFVLFMLSSWMRGYAWIWVVLGAGLGLANRILARRWYRNVVVPWDAERRATKAEIESLRQARQAGQEPA